MNGNINISELSLEKNYMAENVKQADDHLILKTYYRYWSNSTSPINFNLLIILLNRILETNKEGSLMVFLPNCNCISSITLLEHLIIYMFVRLEVSLIYHQFYHKSWQHNFQSKKM